MEQAVINKWLNEAEKKPAKYNNEYQNSGRMPLPEPYEEEPEHKSFRQRYAERKEQNVRLAENPSEDVW